MFTIIAIFLEPAELSSSISIGLIKDLGNR